MNKITLSRRRFLANSAFTAVSAALGSSLLASCSNSGSGAELVFLVPGDQPAGWSKVLAAVNKKLEEEKGITFKFEWIGWSNYADTSLLKYTSGEKFAGSIDAGWLHLGQLADDGALIPLDDQIASGDYPNLTKTIHEKTIESSKIRGKLWGVPQVNNASISNGFTIRRDLADKHGIGQIASYDDFERYLYAVKQHEKSVIPYGLDNGYVNNAIGWSGPGLFNQAAWEAPNEYVVFSMGTPGAIALARTDEFQAGRARLQPFWEVQGIADSLKRVRRYHDDGILNHDVLSVDKNTIYSLFGQGKYASAVGWTNGLVTTTYGATRKNVPGAEIELVVPFGGTTPPKLFSSFGSANNVCVNAKMENPDAVLKLQDWLSIKENHDLLAYGIEGEDWKPVGDTGFQSSSSYVFPGYVASWRAPLERLPADTIDSEKKWFAWSQNFDNFELSPTAGFELTKDAVKTESAQLSAAYSEYALPLFAGLADPAKGLSELQKAFDKAGFDKVLAENEKQLNEFLAKRD